MKRSERFLSSKRVTKALKNDVGLMVETRRVERGYDNRSEVRQASNISRKISSKFQYE